MIFSKCEFLDKLRIFAPVCILGQKLTFSVAAENKAKSERVNELLLGGTAGGGGLGPPLPRPLMLLSRERILTPLGGRAGGSLEGGISGLFPFILCGKMGELVANCEGLTDLVLSVPVLLLVMLLPK